MHEQGTLTTNDTRKVKTDKKKKNHISNKKEIMNHETSRRVVGSLTGLIRMNGGEKVTISSMSPNAELWHHQHHHAGMDLHSTNSHHHPFFHHLHHHHHHHNPTRSSSSFGHEAENDMSSSSSMIAGRRRGPGAPLLPVVVRRKSSEQGCWLRPSCPEEDDPARDRHDSCSYHRDNDDCGTTTTKRRLENHHHDDDLKMKLRARHANIVRQALQLSHDNDHEEPYLPTVDNVAKNTTMTPQKKRKTKTTLLGAKTSWRETKRGDHQESRSITGEEDSLLLPHLLLEGNMCSISSCPRWHHSGE